MPRPRKSQNAKKDETPNPEEAQGAGTQGQNPDETPNPEEAQGADAQDSAGKKKHVLVWVENPGLVVNLVSAGLYEALRKKNLRRLDGPIEADVDADAMLKIKKLAGNKFIRYAIL